MSTRRGLKTVRPSLLLKGFWPEKDPLRRNSRLAPKLMQTLSRLLTMWLPFWTQKISTMTWFWLWRTWKTNIRSILDEHIHKILIKGFICHNIGLATPHRGGYYHFEIIIYKYKKFSKFYYNKKTFFV